MKLQSLKFFALAFVIGAAALVGSVSTANAQTPLAFETSFDFNVGGARMKAGKYELSRIGNGKYVLRTNDQKTGRIIVSLAPVGDGTNGNEKVVFSRYGERYFLRQVFANRGAAGFDIGESSAEREIRKGDDRLAWNGFVEVGLTARGR